LRSLHGSAVAGAGTALNENWPVAWARVGGVLIAVPTDAADGGHALCAVDETAVGCAAAFAAFKRAPGIEDFRTRGRGGRQHCRQRDSGEQCCSQFWH